jgi:hypothetical protein
MVSAVKSGTIIASELTPSGCVAVRKASKLTFHKIPVNTVLRIKRVVLKGKILPVFNYAPRHGSVGRLEV